MKLSKLIKKLQRLKKNHGDMEVRKGTYNCSTETIEGAYHDEDENHFTIY